MNKPMNASARLRLKAGRDPGFRARLLANPKEAIEAELGVKLADGHGVHVHEETDTSTHLVIPPRSKLSEEEREEARTGAASLSFLRRTMHDPAPPRRAPAPKGVPAHVRNASPQALAKAVRESIRGGLAFLEAALDGSGAWHCIRFNVSRPEVPRHFERPPFISALCALALDACGEARAKAICAASREYLVQTMEYPGFWRYYLHLPQDLDSTALCGLLLGSHPWIALERNVPQILANRDDDGRFMTWILAADEPDVAASFRIEADPVVNANVIAYLGDRPETRDAQRWLESLVAEGEVEGKSKWYPNTVTVYYAITRAMVRAQPALNKLRPLLADRILGLRDAQGGFGNVLHTAQAVSALHNVGSLDRIDKSRIVEELLGAQQADGSWPEVLAFGDQASKWGVIGQIGHGSEPVTSAFCVEALAHLEGALESAADCR